MIVQSDLFIAPPAEAEAYALTHSPAFHFPSVLGRGLDEARMAWLLRRLDPESADRVLSTDPEGGLSPGDADLPMTYEIPHPFLHALAGLCDAHLQGAASEWACADVWENHGVTSGALAELLLGIRELARHALFARCGMYLWVGEVEADGS